MIVIYTTTSCASSRRVINWFQKENIPYIERKINKCHPITKIELKELLSLTESGFDDILCFRSKYYKEIRGEFEEYSLEEALNTIIENPSLLKKPIITDGKKIEIGFSKESLRCFIPKNKRISKLRSYYLRSAQQMLNVTVMYCLKKL
ncbi:Spx/MgsR family RNA polymerase-binding regulatory protein [Enterococcus lactis]|uniref:Spx/MgsR family RNA polymerase-binding regulatory protein n=1 Tax=Enterococcus lactis TaxID=357441 RepID=UPI0040424CF6